MCRAYVARQIEHIGKQCYVIRLHCPLMCTTCAQGNTMATVYIVLYPLKSHGNSVSTSVNLTCYYFSLSYYQPQKRTASILQTLSTSTLQIYWRVDVLGTLLYAVKPLYSKCLKLRIPLVF